MNFKKIFYEIKKRNVLKAAISYAVFSWLLIQVASILFPAIGWGQNAIRNTFIILIIGFPLWIIFAYIFEWTTSGFKKTDDVTEESSISRSTNRKMNSVIIVGLSLAVFLLVTDRIFNFTSAPLETASNKNSIAVLAFVDMSPGKDQEYFSDGISEELLNLLAKIPELKVISRTSSFSFKNKDVTSHHIGEQLGVNYILEGSVRKSDNSFRINTQLINTSNGEQIWNETYSHGMEDIFLIQDKIANEVIKQLKITLFGEPSAKMTVDTDAYNLFLQAKQLFYQGSYESGNKALELLEQSQKIDSIYAPGYWLKSRIIFRQTFSYMKTPNLQGLEQGKVAAAKAIEIDPQLYLGYISLASFNRVEWDLSSSHSNIKKAMDLAPENSEVIVEASRNALELGYIARAIHLQEKAIELDPLNHRIYYRLAMSYAWNEQYYKAEENLQKFILMNPNFPYAHALMAEILIKLNKPEEALEELEKETSSYWKLYREIMIKFALGNKSESDLLLKKIENEYGEAYSNLAEIYAYRKDRDRAFKYLELSFENKDAALREALNYPAFKILYGDARWNALIKKFNLPKDHGFHLD